MSSKIASEIPLNSGSGEKNYDDQLHLSNSNHPSMQLTAKKFDGNNYLG